MVKRWQDNITARFSNPPTKDEIREHFGRKLMVTNKKVFDTFMWETAYLDRMVLYVTLGQLPNIRERTYKIGRREYDNRVHAAAFVDSGSGKAGLTEYAGKLATECGLMFYITGEVTDSALLGRRHEVQAYNRETQRLETMVQEEKGCLNPEHDPPVNIFHWNEADVLFDSAKTAWARNTMQHFQKAMNTFQSYDNKLAKDTSLGRIEFHTNASLFVVSKLPMNFYKTVTEMGFLQRMLMDFKKPDWERKKSIDLKTIEVLCEGYDEVEDDVTVSDVAAVLKAINKFWKGKKQVKFSDDAKSLFKDEVFYLLHDPLEKMTPYAQRILSQFVSRWQEQIFNISYHNCYARLGNKIIVQDVTDAKNVVYPLWKNVIYAIEEGLEEPDSQKFKWIRQLKFILQITEELAKKYDKNGWVPRNTLVKVLASKTHGFGCNPETARGRVSKAEEEGYLMRKSVKGSPIVKVSAKPKTI